MASRRKALKAAVAATAFPILNAQQHQHAAGATQSSAAYKPKWATPEEMKLLAELADIIIPRTDTPGASDARVHEYIDYALAGDARRRTIVKEGLASFSNFTARAVALESASRSARDSNSYQFFKILKDLTIDGYYQSREGLVQELGWSGNTFLHEFKGCTNPEHIG